MIADLGDDELPHIPSGIINQARSASPRVTDGEGARAEEGTAFSIVSVCIPGFLTPDHLLVLQHAIVESAHDRRAAGYDCSGTKHSF